MAFIVLNNGQVMTLSHEKATLIDKVKRGLVLGSAQQKAFAAKVKKIYFGKQYEESTTTPYWNR